MTDKGKDCYFIVCNKVFRLVEISDNLGYYNSNDSLQKLFCRDNPYEK